MEKVIYLRHPKYSHIFCGSNGMVWSCATSKSLGYVNKIGYSIISMTCGKKIKAHRLIIECFRGESDLCVDHIDGNKLNNCIENLEYVTSSENTKRAHITGLVNNWGEKNSICKLSDEKIKEIRAGNKKGKKEKIAHAKELGITIGYYYRVLRNEIRPN